MVFSQLPESFFQPLASPNRRHYAELLLIYYRLFLEYHTGVERELVVARFTEYFVAIDREEREERAARPMVVGSLSKAETDAVFEAEPDVGIKTGTGVETETESEPIDPRQRATHYLRRLIVFGWMDEEEQLDFSRNVTIRSHARPFLEALDKIDRGAEIEYESHIVAVYSELTGEAARENGEHAVLNAHYHTRLLIESLKVLDQNIRSHVQTLFEADATIPEILHSHYDVYMHEVVDHAYTRLKTSDNLSRYRPRIAKAITAFLDDRDWLERTSERLSRIQRTDKGTATQRVRAMLVEIRDDLASIDPILESIDDRNRRYSRISTERIRARLHTDTSLPGRISRMISQIRERSSDERIVELGIHRLRHIDIDSLYIRRSREVPLDMLERPLPELDEEERAATELRLRVQDQLNPRRVADYLGRHCPRPGDAVWAHDLAETMEDYVRLLYAANYAERKSDGFRFDVEWYDEQVQRGRFAMQQHRFIRRYERG